MVGPKMDMFETQDDNDMEEDRERNRKNNSIYENVKDVLDNDEDEDYEMPVSHEVLLGGHNRAI